MKTFEALTTILACAAIATRGVDGWSAKQANTGGANAAAAAAPDWPSHARNILEDLYANKIFPAVRKADALVARAVAVVVTARESLEPELQPYFSLGVVLATLIVAAMTARTLCRRKRQLNGLISAIEKSSNDTDWGATGWKRVQSSLGHVRKNHEALEAKLVVLGEKVDRMLESQTETAVRLANVDSLLAQLLAASGGTSHHEADKRATAPQPQQPGAVQGPATLEPPHWHNFPESPTPASEVATGGGPSEAPTPGKRRPDLPPKKRKRPQRKRHSAIAAFPEREA